MNFQRYAISPYLKIALAGFVVAAVGAVLGFAGVRSNAQWIAQLGFLLALLGVVIGFLGIFLGWFKEGRSAIQGSRKAAENMRDKIYKRAPNKDQ